jgi:hypothetical protein
MSMIRASKFISTLSPSERYYLLGKHADGDGLCSDEIVAAVPVGVSKNKGKTGR